MEWNTVERAIKTETDTRTEYKRVGKLGWFMSKDINSNNLTTWRWARGYSEQNDTVIRHSTSATSFCMPVGKRRMGNGESPLPLFLTSVRFIVCPTTSWCYYTKQSNCRNTKKSTQWATGIWDSNIRYSSPPSPHPPPPPPATGHSFPQASSLKIKCVACWGAWDPPFGHGQAMDENPPLFCREMRVKGNLQQCQNYKNNKPQQSPRQSHAEDQTKQIEATSGEDHRWREQAMPPTY